MLDRDLSALYEVETRALRVAEGNKYPKIAPDFGPDTRRFEGGISGIFTLRSNAVAGPKDKQDGIIIFFRDP